MMTGPHYYRQPPHYGPPHQQPPYWGVVGYGWYPPRPQNGLGIAGMVLGIIGLVFSFMPLANLFIGLPCCVIGATLSGVGLQRVRQRTANNHGQAVTGITCASVGLALTALLIVVGAAS